jgi:hypothetical protein
MTCALHQADVTKVLQLSAECQRDHSYILAAQALRTLHAMSMVMPE